MAHIKENIFKKMRRIAMKKIRWLGEKGAGQGGLILNKGVEKGFSLEIRWEWYRGSGQVKTWGWKPYTEATNTKNEDGKKDEKM